MGGKRPDIFLPVIWTGDTSSSVESYSQSLSEFINKEIKKKYKGNRIIEGRVPPPLGIRIYKNI